MDNLIQYLHRQAYGVVCSYAQDDVVAIIAGVQINDDDSLWLHFLQLNPFRIGDKVTIHLDDRTGLEVFSSDLRVHRCSYKGVVIQENQEKIKVQPEEFILKYGGATLIDYKKRGYLYPVDVRSEIKLPRADFSSEVFPDEREKENKLGVWITRAHERPHTTVMAFLSSENDDIYVISHVDNFKSNLIHRDNRCLFAIDHRATFNFEKKYEWNYTIIKAVAELVDRSQPEFVQIQGLFVDKNPWEILFFTDPKVEMFHLRPLEIMCPEKYKKLKH